MQNASTRPAIIRARVPMATMGTRTLVVPMWMSARTQMHVAPVPYAQTSMAVIAATALKVSTVMPALRSVAVTKMSVPSLRHVVVMPSAKMKLAVTGVFVRPDSMAIRPLSAKVSTY